MVDIEFRNITKKYGLYKNDLKRLLSVLFKKKFENTKNILDNISFNINVGESVCLIGKNGSGKSTILKIISGITTPSNGYFIVKRRVNSLLNVVLGFDANFTGRENIYIRGALLGFSKKEMNKYLKDIIDFSEIDESMIDQELKRYSSGMVTRLGFSINLISDPKILVIDEALAVGDAVFVKKCIDRIKEMRKKHDLTIILVSHSKKLSLEFCDRGIYIKKGIIIYDGETENAFNQYYLDNNID
ncbi:MAG: ABC transporter ATP-binding protein [Mycoplasmoidaceae bacterium]